MLACLNALHLMVACRNIQGEMQYESNGRAYSMAMFLRSTSRRARPRALMNLLMKFILHNIP
jgi:hypothetical protein